MPGITRFFQMIAIAIALFLAVPGGARAEAPFSDLKQRLVSDGFDPVLVESLYGENGAAFDLSSATGYFRHREYKLDYNQFLTEDSIRRARAYREEHGEALLAAKKKTGVDPEIIVAILLVESRLGRFAGNRKVLDTLSTLAALDREDNQKRLFEAVNKKQKVSMSKVRSWGKRKSGWAYNELKAFLVFCREQQADPAVVAGSYAGAMGFCQFMPTSAASHAADGDADGRVDLYTHADAIMSIGRYLKNHGYSPPMTKREMKKALFTYNKSDPYVITLIRIRSRLLEAP